MTTAIVLAFLYFVIALAGHLSRCYRTRPVVTAPVVLTAPVVEATAPIITPAASPAAMARLAEWHEATANVQRFGSTRVPAAAKAMSTVITFTVPDAELMPVVASEAIDWALWNCADLRWVATRLGIKGAARMKKAEAMAAVEAAIA